MQIWRKIQGNFAHYRSISWALSALKKSHQDEWITGPTKQGYKVRAVWHNEQPYGFVVEMVERSFVNRKYIYHGKWTLSDIKLTNTLS